MQNTSSLLTSITVAALVAEQYGDLKDFNRNYLENRRFDGINSSIRTALEKQNLYGRFTEVLSQITQ